MQLKPQNTIIIIMITTIVLAIKSAEYFYVNV